MSGIACFRRVWSSPKGGTWALEHDLYTQHELMDIYRREGRELREKVEEFTDHSSVGEILDLPELGELLIRAPIKGRAF